MVFKYYFTVFSLKICTILFPKFSNRVKIDQFTHFSYTFYLTFTYNIPSSDSRVICNSCNTGARDVYMAFIVLKHEGVKLAPYCTEARGHKVCALVLQYNTDNMYLSDGLETHVPPIEFTCTHTSVFTILPPLS